MRYAHSMRRAVCRVYAAFVFVGSRRIIVHTRGSAHGGRARGVADNGAARELSAVPLQTSTVSSYSCVRCSPLLVSVGCFVRPSCLELAPLPQTHCLRLTLHTCAKLARGRLASLEVSERGLTAARRRRGAAPRGASCTRPARGRPEPLACNSAHSLRSSRRRPQP